MKDNSLDPDLVSERSQAIVRCCVATVVMLILAYLAITTPASRAGGLQAMSAVGVFWIISVLWTVWVWRSHKSYAFRRLGGLVFDIAGTTLAFVLAEELSAFFYPVYQWIIIGHGLRYGKQAMVAATICSVTGFAVSIILTPYWQENILVASGLMLGLFILPMYLFALIEKLHNLNTQLKTELSRTYHAVIHDPLTGITNRQYFRSQLVEMIHKADKYNRGLAVLFIDLDEFKDINDRLGHSAGDKVLQIVAERLSKNCREQDVTSRFGGDEFALILTDTDRETIEGTAQRVIRALREPVSIDGKRYQLSGSIGVSLFPDDGKTADELTHNADVAMYQAKRNGKNSYIYFSELVTA